MGCKAERQTLFLAGKNKAAGMGATGAAPDSGRAKEDARGKTGSEMVERGAVVVVLGLGFVVVPGDV